MGFLSENCAFAPLTEQLHGALTGFDCQREPAIQDFFRNEAILNAKELMSKSYCFYKKDTMQAVAAFCVELEDGQPLLTRFMISDLK